MDCDRAREAISALLDGEPPPVRGSELEWHLHTALRGLAGALVSVAVVLAAAGCGSTTPTAARASASMPGGTTTTAGAAEATGSMSSSEMSAMEGGAGKATAMPEAMPIVPLAHTTWEGMKIEARAMAPVPFDVFTGTSEKLVRPTKRDSIHLMVMLTDAESGVDIPYATVWATIRKGSEVVYDNRQWPMISRYMGSHYGNNVALPGPGTYHLSLLVGPPQSARHIEYEKVWLRPHRVNMTFHWAGTAGR